MEKFRKELPVILLSVCATLLLVAVILLINGNKFSFTNNTSKEKTNENNTATIKENKNTNTNVNSNTSVNNTVESIKEVNTNNSSNTTTNTPSTQVSNTNQNNNTTQNKIIEENKGTNVEQAPVKAEVKNSLENISGDENSVVAYFENISNMNTNDTSLSEKIKNGFVTIIDFIFYDKEINGHTFKELTGTAKLKIIGFALKIDNKIDSYFPGYKERLSEKYKSVKEKLAELYADYTVKVCETIVQDNCSKLREDYEKMKTNFGIAGDYLKNAFSKGSSKLKEWYENWKNK